MLTRRRATNLLFCALFMAPAAARAQANGSISGRVIDNTNGKPIPGVAVNISGSRSGITDADGRYLMRGVPAGMQVVVFRWIGFTPQSASATVSVNQTTTLNASLSPLPLQLGAMVVTAGSKVSERVLDAPAAVVVVEPWKLRALAGTGQTPQLLADLPGIRLAPSSMFDFNLNARGFNTGTNRRVLVLIDGRDTSIPILGNQDWADIVVLEQASHVEMVRGPGAALYGANAFNGVLSIETPSIREDPSLKTNITFGDHETIRDDARWAHLSDDQHWGFRASGGYQQSQTFDKSRTGANDTANEYAEAGVAPSAVMAPAPGYEYAPLNGQTKPGVLGAPATATGKPDPVRTYFGAGRVDYYPANGSVVVAEGGVGRTENVVFATAGGRSQVLAATRPWARVAWSGDHSKVFGYYTGRDGKSLTLSNATIGYDRTGTYQVEGLHDGEFASARGRYVVGASLRDVQIDSKGTILAAADDGRHDRFYAAYEQVDVRVTNKLKAVLASRLDQGTLNDAQFSPKLGLLYSPTHDQALRLTWNRGFLSPSALQRFLSYPAGPPLDLSALEGGLRASPLGPALAGVPAGTLFTLSSAVPLLALGNRNLRSERVNGVELGYKVQAGNLFITADLYRSTIYDFGTPILAGVNSAYGPWKAPAQVAEAARAALEGAVLQAVGPGLTRLQNGNTAYVLSFGNAGRATEHGGELAAGYRLGNAIRLDANYSYYKADIDQSQFAAGDTTESNTPSNSGNVALGYVNDRWQSQLSVRYEEAYKYRSGLWKGVVPAATTVDVSVCVPVKSSVSISIAGTNLLDQRRFHVYGGSIIGRRILVTTSATF